MINLFILKNILLFWLLQLVPVTPLICSSCTTFMCQLRHFSVAVTPFFCDSYATFLSITPLFCDSYATFLWQLRHFFCGSYATCSNTLLASKLISPNGKFITKSWHVVTSHNYLRKLRLSSQRILTRIITRTLSSWKLSELCTVYGHGNGWCERVIFAANFWPKLVSE